MALDVEKGTFTKTTSTAAPVSQQVNLSNSSLTPKALILWTSGTTAFNAFQDDSRFSYGFSDGTNDACQSYRMDESTESESYAFRNNAVISIIDLTTNAEVSIADVSAFGTGSFTLNWSTQSNTQALNIHYCVIGGSDITNVSVVNTNKQDVATGNHSWTGSGTAFTPDFALTMTGTDSYTVNTLSSSLDRAMIAVGAIDSAGNEWIVSGRDETATTSDCDMYINPNACMVSHDPASGATTYLADFVSFNNAAGGGVTLNVTDAATNAATPIAFLFIKGGVWECGAFQQRSGTGTQNVTYSNASLDTSMVFLAGISSATSASVVANMYLGFGASDGTNEGCTSIANLNGQGTFVTSFNDSNTKVYRIHTPAATATSSTTNAECDLTAMSTGQFTLNWTTADTTLRRMAWWAVGVSGPANFTRSPSPDSVTVSESVLGYKPGPAQVKFGTITMDATSGAHTQTFTNELGFRPKGMIFWGTGQTATGTAAKANMSVGMSSDNATGELGWVTNFPDADTISGNTTNTNSDPNNCINVFDGTTIFVEASPNFQANGFDLVYVTKTNTTQYKLNYFAFTAPNIQNVESVTYTTTAGTGLKDITSIGYTGTIAFFAGGYWGSNATSGGNTGGFGVAMNSSKQWFVAFGADNVSTTNTSRQQRTDRCYMTQNTLSGFPALVYEGSFDSWLSNGLRINWTTNGDNGDAIAVMVVQGGDWDLGAFNQAISNGNQVITTASDLNNKGVLFASFNNTSTTSAVDHARFSIGGGDGTTECSAWVGITDNVTTSIAKKDHNETKAVRLLDETSGGSTLRAEADLTSVDTGDFTINWTTTDATAREICWVACGDRFAQGQSFTGTPTAESITISEASLTRVKSAARAPATESPTVSEASLTRIKSATRVPSSDSVTIAENSLTRSKTWPRVPSADSTTVSDASVSRMLSAVRVPNTEAPAVSENLTRSKSANRTPSSDSTTVSDGSVTRSVSLTRLPSAETVTPADVSTTKMITRVRAPNAETVTPTDSSLTRMLQLFRSPSSDSITTSENITGGRVFDRDVSADSVTITEASLNRMLSAVRVPTGETVALAENLTRSKTWPRVPSADSVTAQDSSTTKSITRIRTPNAETVTVSDSSITRLLQAVRSPSADSVVIVDTGLTRILQAFRTPSSDTVIVSENVTGGKVIARTPTAETVTVTDASLNRLLSLLRIPAANSVTVVDSSLTRLLSAVRVPSTEVVSTSENVTGEKVQGAQQYNRSPAAESVIVVDSSLSRVLSALRVPSVEVISITDSSLTRLLQLFRTPTSETVSVSENINVTASGRVSRSTSDTVDISENLSRLLQSFRTPTTEGVNVNEQLTRIASKSRAPSSDSITVSEIVPTRVVSRVRATSDTPGVVEASLTRVLFALRSLSDTTIVSEVQSLISHARRLEESVAVTEPVIERIVTAIRATAPDTVSVNESVFFQALHKFVFDSVVVADQIFSERQGLSGPVTYAIPSEVRPLLGNIGNQRTDAQIELAIDSAYDEINRRTGRQPPNEWKDTENDFGIIKKITRFKAALEMAIGIKDFEDREWMQKEIEEMFKIIEEGEGESGTTSTDVVGSSPDETFALAPGGIIWSIRYPGLKKGSTGNENDTTINPAA